MPTNQATKTFGLIEEHEMEIAESSPPFRSVIGFSVTALPFEDQISLMLDWARSHYSRVVCIANVHMLVEAYREAGFGAILKRADLVTPDGMPLVWMLRLLGVSNQDRVAGLDVLLALCEQASVEDISVFFLGSHTAILEKMRIRLETEFPNLKIAGMEPLPFREITRDEDNAITQTLNNSGAGLVFVSLGCPKQEIWMAAHRDRVRAVMVGLGGAFPVYAGVHKRAPRLIRSLGFEWLYRLIQEPRRLWGRYSSTIPLFIWLALKQLLTTDRATPTQEMP
ncbi:WecB/TagA/CpsF family glycosyltransferase [Leptothermofonsia sichuanensis E412]|uniref:WecB/TagA/CpsF family glycosyltransferase n=1 Tax=Leptothermofonsia sichuanensis TaxID=2917832 RepID=UPI001CA6CCDE|nr:WecB/TagA/CpsF family glycosyltransferase [Leptothermofonsia sichuanensis E412]